ncbi:NlpC/P60 family protein [Modestobacter sp. VKM Ac-2986]|uniref:C40 family peptidase n=1 Tax=Modestobacter sp. VKM Ac-2986 TaxID=3004140 RepID=UPI0022AB66F3|nr:NlpC/P60 family protein [Modestobacter sp. VKM Ac-2986]MCZ2830343.1 NlpC/P60 family protein [Modestobacter sp. VKM Ac-2986]
MRRLAGVAVVAALSLVASPGIAAAVPTNPSDAQIDAAQEQTQTAAQQVEAITAALAGAQASVDSAREQSAIALDEFQGKQAEHEAAEVAADAATAAADAAARDLEVARADVAAFARQSYQQGSTSPTLEALTTADGPAQMLERAALLEAAGAHQGDVVVRVTAAEEQARAAEGQAQAALAAAAALEREAADALALAEQYEASARAQAAALAVQQDAVEQQLAQARQSLQGLQAARAEAERFAAEQAAAARAAAARAESERAAAAQRAAAAPAPRATAPAPRGTTQPVQAPVRSVPVGPAAGAGDSSAVETAIAAARRHIGVIYSWGGGSLTGPSMGWGIDAGIVGFDCSGLTRYAYAQAGVAIPRNSRAQYAALPKVSRSDLQRGDLVFWATNTSSPATIHHVAIYLGDDRILEAPQSGSRIRETSMRWGGFIGGARPTA